MKEKETSVRLTPTQEIINRNDQLTAQINQYLEANKDNDHYDYADVNDCVEEQQNLHEKYNFFDQVFEENGLKGLKDVKGKVLIPARYHGFHETFDYNHFRKYPIGAYNEEGKCALITTDGTGTELTPFEYDGIAKFTWYDMYITKKGDKKGLLNLKGEVLAPCELDTIYDAFNDIIQLEQGDKCGLITADGRLYVKPIYDEITDKDEDVYVRLGDKWGFLDEEGTFIDEADEEKQEASYLLNFRIPD